MTRASTEPVDDMFDDDPTPPPAPSRPYEDPPELRARLVSALGGETTDEALTPGEFRAFRQETIDILQRLTDGQEAINKQLLPLIADHGRRITDGERRADRTDDRLDASDARLDVSDQRHVQTGQRLDKHERDLRAVLADVAKLNKAAATRAKRK